MTHRSNYNFTGWQGKVLGRQPTEAELGMAAALSPRQAHGKQTLALALAMRDCGMTADQMIAAVSTVFGQKGTPQNNHRRELERAGLIKRVDPMLVNGRQCYRMVLTDAGEAYVKRQADKAAASKAAAKPVKAAPKAPRKPKAPVSEPVTVEPTAPVEAPTVEPAQPTA